MMRLVALLFVLCGIAVSGAPVFAEATGSPLDESREDLAQLEELLKDKKATDHEMIEYIRAVAERHAKAEGSEKDVAAFRKDAESVLLTALTKARVRRDANELEAVNTAAARTLAELGPNLDAKARKSLASKIKRHIGALTNEKRYDPSPEKLDATFALLARVGSDDTLAWFLEEFSHTNFVESDFLVAAHKAMVLFPDASGKLRYAIVKRFRERYASVESQAQQSANTPGVQAKKRLWDKIRTHTIAVVQHFARFPEVNGVALATMGEFEDWFRDHKNVRKAPWTDTAE